MKKLIVLLLCCLVLGGCGSKDIETSEETTTERQTATETTEQESQPENLYETEQLVDKLVGVVKYQIPKSWDENCEELDIGICYTYNQAFVLVWNTEYSINKYSEMTGEKKKAELEQCVSDATSELKQLKFYDVSWDSSEIIEKGETKIADSDAYREKYNLSANGTVYYIDSIAIGTYKDVYVFTLFVNKSEKVDCENEFESLINSINIIKSKGEIFEEFKTECLANVRKDVSKSDEALGVAIKNFEESFFSVKKLNNYHEASNNNDFSNFIYAISYLTEYMEDETIGKSVGESGWRAVESLMISDGTFTEKMDNVKKLYERSGNYLFENKYEPGQYKVGYDIPAGEYVFFVEGSSGYFGVTSDANGNDIIANDNFSHNSIMTVKEGEYLELSRCYAVPIGDVSTIPQDKGTMFKIGAFLPAGEYKLISDSDSGYYCIYGDNRQGDIVSNDNFNGQSYINVSDGQYLVLSRCHIEP